MSLEVFQDNKWCAFYPIISIYDDLLDKRPVEEILKQEKIYGKAIIGVVGYNPAYMYATWKRDQIRVRK